jgi:hypothetical protein
MLNVSELSLARKCSCAELQIFSAEICMVSKNARFLLFYSLCRLPRLFSPGRTPVNRVANCYSSENMKCLRRPKPHAPKSYLQAACYDCVAIIIAGGFPVVPPSRHRRPI